MIRIFRLVMLNTIQINAQCHQFHSLFFFFFHQQQEILVTKEVPYLSLEFGCCDLEKVLWLYFQK